MPFVKGTGGRPKGARNKKRAAVRDLLDKLGTGPKGQDLHTLRLHELTLSEDEHVRVKALTTVLAYRWGKPTEHMELTGEGGGPVRVKFVDADV